MSKHREITTLQINRISQSDTGVYAIGVFGRNSENVATFNVES